MLEVLDRLSSTESPLDDVFSFADSTRVFVDGINVIELMKHEKGE